MAWARPVAVASAALSGALLALAAGLITQAPTASSWATLGIGGVIVLAAGILGVVVADRPQAPVVGVLLTLVAVATAHVVAREIGFRVIAGQPDPDRWALLAAVLAQSAWLVLVAVGLLLLLFPDGRLPSRRWRWVPPALVACAAIDIAYGAVDPAPFRAPLEELPHPWPAPPVWVEAVDLVAFVGVLGLTLACAASLVLRYRRSARRERQQIKWLALAGLGVPLYPPLCLVEILAWGRPLWVSSAVGVVALVGIPVATGVAVLRHDLYDVDKAIATTVTWSLLTVALVAVYAVTSSWTGVLLGQESSVVAAVGTAACAVLLSPLRRRVQRLVDQRLYPLRGSALAAVDALHRDVSAGTATPEQLETRLREALRDPGLRVGYRLPGADRYVDASGAQVGGGGVPVVLEEQPTGVLVPTTELAPELLRDVGAACTTLVEVVRLRLEVADALREAESSRARLVETGYRERRRLEKDLHDGAQQRLVSLGMALRLAQRHLTDGTVDVDALLDESVAELGTAVAELRQLAHGLRPSSLDDGLPAALSNLVRSLPLTVDMEVDSAPLPDAVATTAYYVISEAVANAVKHAEATRIELRVERRDGAVEVVVSDDGRGGASVGVGSGLSDRVAALGGTLHVLSPPGRGTVVRAALPFETPRARVVGASSLGPDGTAPSPQEPPCAS